MAETRDGGEDLRESIREMVSHCEAMQDEAKALEVGAGAVLAVFELLGVLHRMTALLESQREQNQRLL